LLDLAFHEFPRSSRSGVGLLPTFTTPFSEMLSYCDDPYLAHRGSEKEHLRKERMK